MKNIDYQKLMSRAMLRVVGDALSIVQEHGLPDEGAIMISFRADHEQAKLSERLSKKYPKAINIVIEEWYRDLAVEEEGFWITLNFQEVPERLFIPFQSITKFLDIGSNFGLGFKKDKEETEEDDLDPTSGSGNGKARKGPAQIISLDTFRSS